MLDNQNERAILDALVEGRQAWAEAMAGRSAPIEGPADGNVRLGTFFDI